MEMEAAAVEVLVAVAAVAEVERMENKAECLQWIRQRQDPGRDLRPTFEVRSVSNMETERNQPLLCFLEEE